MITTHIHDLTAVIAFVHASLLFLLPSDFWTLYFIPSESVHVPSFMNSLVVTLLSAYSVMAFGAARVPFQSYDHPLMRSQQVVWSAFLYFSVFYMPRISLLFNLTNLGSSVTVLALLATAEDDDGEDDVAEKPINIYPILRPKHVEEKDD